MLIIHMNQYKNKFVLVVLEVSKLNETVKDRGMNFENDEYDVLHYQIYVQKLLFSSCVRNWSETTT